MGVRCDQAPGANGGADVGNVLTGNDPLVSKRGRNAHFTRLSRLSLPGGRTTYGAALVGVLPGLGSRLTGSRTLAEALSEYLGHHDPGFTLRTYTHLMPSSGSRTRTAVDRVFP